MENSEKDMKKGATTFTRIVLLVLFCGSLTAPVLAGLPVGAAAPDFTLPTITGAKLSLSQFRGQVVILHFWKSD